MLKLQTYGLIKKKYMTCYSHELKSVIGIIGLGIDYK